MVQVIKICLLNQSHRVMMAINLYVSKVRIKTATENLNTTDGVKGAILESGREGLEPVCQMWVEWLNYCAKQQLKEYRRFNEDMYSRAIDEVSMNCSLKL